MLTALFSFIPKERCVGGYSPHRFLIHISDFYILSQVDSAFRPHCLSPNRVFWSSFHSRVCALNHDTAVPLLGHMISSRVN